VRLSENVERSVGLNQNKLCVYGLSKGCNTEITEYIWKIQEIIRKMVEKAVFACYKYY
jgi:hypothetical protein